MLGNKGHQHRGKEIVFRYHGAAGRIWCHICYPTFLTVCKGQSVFQCYGCECGHCVHVWGWSGLLWNLSPLAPLSSVCGVDESSPRRAGRIGCHRLQVRSHRGKETILLLGGPAVVCYQAAHQLPLQGDLFMFIMVKFTLSHVESITKNSFIIITVRLNQTRRYLTALCHKPSPPSLLTEITHRNNSVQLLLHSWLWLEAILVQVVYQSHSHDWKTSGWL